MMARIRKSILLLLDRLRQYHDTSARIADAILCLLGGLSAFLVREPARAFSFIATVVGIWLAVKVVVFHFYRLHRTSWRHSSTPELRLLLQANIVASALGAILVLSAFGSRTPRSLPVLDLVLTVAYLTGARFLVRMNSEVAAAPARRPKRLSHAFIYGAGKAGVSLLRELRQNPALGYEVTGFVDDDSRKHGSYLHGLRVLGAGGELRELAVQYPVDQVLVAIATASAAQMNTILENCMSAGLMCRIIPGMTEVVEGRAQANQIRQFSIEDLLGRRAITLHQHSISAALTGKTVLVTGGAGSIGSELCRQILRYEPKAVIAYDSAETPLFFLDSEMKGRQHGARFHPVIGSIQDPQRLGEVIRSYRPDIVFHAAAYKHVPVMEGNPFEAVANNIFGTETVLHASLEGDVRAFVMISTDKAVRPTNVMGTTKRIAELLVNAYSSEAMKCVSVRFGNVLGSNGSVIPIFRRQIAAGGPVSVTHPEMRRYFMTIPEASQLVLQASAIGKSGEILVLDMGEPVKILDLAQNMIRLAGLRPMEDIAIRFSGIRPGEKLYEELNLQDESMIATDHEKIKVFRGAVWQRSSMDMQLLKIRAAWQERDTAALLQVMKEAVPEYSLNPELMSAQGDGQQTAGEFEFSATLLGGVDRRLSAKLVELSDRVVSIVLLEPVSIGVALKLEMQEKVLLGEVCACKEEGEGYLVRLNLEYSLQRQTASAP